jgi:hypothetical protein
LADCSCCSSCYSKVKFFLKFLTVIEEAQESIDSEPPSQEDPLIDIKQETEQPQVINFENKSDSDDDLGKYSDERQSKESSGSPRIISRSRKSLSKKKIKRYHNNFVCAKCKKRNKSFVALETHLIACFGRPQPVETQFICAFKYCRKTFDTKKGLSVHMISHKNEKPK